MKYDMVNFFNALRVCFAIVQEGLIILHSLYATSSLGLGRNSLTSGKLWQL